MIENKFSPDSKGEYPSVEKYPIGARILVRDTFVDCNRQLTTRGKAVGNLYWSLEISSLGTLSQILGGEDKAVKWINTGGDLRALSKEISDEILFPRDDEGNRVDTEFEIGSEEFFQEFARKFTEETSDIERATGERNVRSVELLELEALQAEYKEIEAFLASAETNRPSMEELLRNVGKRAKVVSRIAEIKEIRSAKRAANKIKNAEARKKAATVEATPAV